ncbi:hypothetical protein CLU79DRAFT_66917 [Phycomyces nitens]|nr:hypothetical protein CLU79DRAFT_66917 [Phycomyces nitens]
MSFTSSSPARPHAKRLGPAHIGMIHRQIPANLCQWKHAQVVDERPDPKGRYVVTVDPVYPGTILLREQPFIKHLYHNYRHSHCTACFLPVKKPVRCRRSGCIWPLVFCSAVCENENWETGIHSWLCQFPEAKQWDDDILLALDGYTKARAHWKSGSNLTTLSDLVSNLEHHSQTQVSEYRAKAKEMASFFYLSDHAIDSLVVIQAQIRCNSFSIQHTASTISSSLVSQMSDSLGRGVYLSASRLNHACSPNAIVTFGQENTPSLLVVRATETVTSARQNVSISYGPMAAKHSLEERRSLLSDHYFFECQCKACLPSAEVTSESIYQCQQCPLGRLYRLQSRCPVCGAYPEWKAINDQEKAIEGYIGRGQLDIALECQERIYDKEAYPIGRTVDELARVYAMQGAFELSAKYSSRSLGIVQRTFGTLSLEAAEEMMKLSSLLFERQV